MNPSVKVDAETSSAGQHFVNCHSELVSESHY